MVTICNISTGSENNTASNSVQYSGIDLETAVVKIDNAQLLITNSK